MINAQDKLQEVRLVSANVAEYVDSELYRLEADKDAEWTDFEILTYCIPILVSELQELGVYIALDDTDYLTEWTYSDGIVALRQLLDKENLPIFFKNNSEYLEQIKFIFSNIQSDDEDLIKDLLEMMLTKNIGDPYQLDRIRYLSDYVYSDISFRDYINFLLKSVSNVKTNISDMSDNINNIEDYRDFVNTLNDNIVPLWHQSVNDLIRLGINLDKSIIEKMEKEYLSEYISSPYTKKYLYLFYNSTILDEHERNLLLNLRKDIRVRLQSVLPYSLSNYLIKKDVYTLVQSVIHYGAMMRLYKISCNPELNPNTIETYHNCYNLLKHSLKIGIKEDIKRILENIVETNISSIISEYLEDIVKHEGDPI